MSEQAELTLEKALAIVLNEIGKFNRFQLEAHKFYRGDGTYEIVESSEEVIKRRIAAAKLLEELPNKVADRLFTVVPEDDYANRLVMETTTKFDAPGWCKQAVADQVKELISSTKEFVPQPSNQQGSS